MLVVRDAALVMEAVRGPLIWLQAPVPVAGLLAAIVAVPLEAQMVWSGPAFDTVGGALTLIVTSLVDAAQGLLVMVQRKVRVPAVLRPVMVEVGKEGVVIVAAVPLTWVQEPMPTVAVLAAMVTVAPVVQIVCVGPALAVVGAATTVKFQLPHPEADPAALRGTIRQEWVPALSTPVV